MNPSDNFGHLDALMMASIGVPCPAVVALPARVPKYVFTLHPPERAATLRPLGWRLLSLLLFTCMSLQHRILHDEPSEAGAVDQALKLLLLFSIQIFESNLGKGTFLEFKGLASL